MEEKIDRNETNSIKRKTPNSLYVEIGKRLRASRLNSNYTQEQMAEILEMSTAYYGKVERGLYGLSLTKLIIVNEKLDIDINYLLTGVYKKSFSKDQILLECPREKRYDMEKLIKYAVNLARGPENFKMR